MLKTPGERFKYFRQAIGFKQAKLAEKLEVPQNTISKIEKDKQLPSKPVFKLLEYLFRLNRDFILEGKGDMFLLGEASREKGEELHEFLVREAGWPPPYGARRPVGGRDWITFQRATGPGPGGQVLESDQLVDHIAFRRDWIRARIGGRAADLVLVETAGDSMEPT
ncbi:MAG: helix-turn-helix domain-containing protein, partial [Nitrospinaceae bacterium]|nr:helix-turn-helix transcriptional regulator [Nitrospinaceae bacterium]NIS87662.1 helix-turn-helix transcriptional regulator [Nitrospinaceae bacterium]NIT84528.1 helix-turn-helix transcriptional regulator [Nitrospinaceae bacterium]NIU46718.1 helix-turn-helix transcriptional regulator [Nitrospinaceae bacterium]NIU98911.1 helix-turn-helix domain-containing protein [Nitrospinaceae bacterium]